MEYSKKMGGHFIIYPVAGGLVCRSGLDAPGRPDHGLYRPEHLAADFAGPDYLYAKYRPLLVVTAAFLVPDWITLPINHGFTI